ncbi:hypothetical protein [Pedobacter metabolipauper]|uniref:Uncharacterized protein n=1 Tax=Pedobacter metabolipauper TaxID=425513 RepID=A0A4R6SZ99_9SPHI|nr:hypothetical protein [Pedobacter metabolipauper]TDQ11099.1 hypothetical protein ATK78_0213 [Pedobacter metabolipauper]
MALQETKELLDRIKHHDKLLITVNENCAIALPDDILQKLLQPHKLAHYCFVFIDQGSETYKVDLQNMTISDGQLAFWFAKSDFQQSTKNLWHPGL